MKKRTEILRKGLIAIFLLAVFALACQPKVDKKNLKLLILGNSITTHGPSEALDWHGNWGMAASSVEKDYVHVLKRKLEALGANVTIEIVESGWERDFNFDFSQEKLTTFQSDILIVRLGENVPESSIKNYESALIQLIEKFKFKYAIITGNFWPAQSRDSIQSKVASEKGYEYADLSEIWADASYRADGLFKDLGVGAHPSDKGMEKIADEILEKIEPLIE